MFSDIETNLEIKVVDYFCTFEYLLSYISVYFPSVSSSCFCPFHENTNTKAAKFYNIENPVRICQQLNGKVKDIYINNKQRKIHFVEVGWW